MSLISIKHEWSFVNSFNSGVLISLSENDPSLYKSEFCGLKYWGPSSRTTGPISGFAHAAIKQPIGRLFSERDIKILETLFWPFANQFGYTDITKEDFLKRLEEFKPSLDTPLDFERQLYAELDNNELPIEQLLPYKTMRSELKNAWCILEKRETFPGLMQPLTTVWEMNSSLRIFII